MNNSKFMGGRKSPPSLFDIALYVYSFLVPIVICGTFDLNQIQKVAFVFGTFALWGISFFCKKEREYKNKFLGFFILWSMMCVFIHSLKYAHSQVIQRYINFAVLSEGFIYVFCACVLFKLVVEHKRNFNIIYPVLAINILNLFFVIVQILGKDLIWTNVVIPCGVMGTIYNLKIFSALSIPILFNFRIKGIWTPICLIPVAILGLGLTYGAYNGFLAVYLALLLYLYFTSNRMRLGLFLMAGLIVVFYKHNILIDKLLWRCGVWFESIKEIVKSPWIGHGFDNSLKQNLVEYQNAWSYRQNDYLNIARDLGLPFLGMVILFIRNVLRGVKRDHIWFAVVTLLFACGFQTSMYYVRIASFGVILLALLECNKYESFGK